MSDTRITIARIHQLFLSGCDVAIKTLDGNYRRVDSIVEQNVPNQFRVCVSRYNPETRRRDSFTDTVGSHTLVEAIYY